MVFPRVFAVSLLAISVFLNPAQAQNKDAVQKALNSTFQYARPNAAHDDLLEGGSVLVLQKEGLLLSASSVLPTGNVYKNGTVTPEGFIAKFNDRSVTRNFHVGEKFFVTSAAARSDAVSFEIMSDFLPVPGQTDQRYRGSLKIPYPNKTIPSANDVLAMISQVVKIDNPDPPPPPAPARSAVKPATISMGMTRAQVIAAFGTPSKVVHLGAKEIDVFPDMKVTFIKGKVADVK